MPRYFSLANGAERHPGRFAGLPEPSLSKQQTRKLGFESLCPPPARPEAESRSRTFTDCKDHRRSGTVRSGTLKKTESWSGWLRNEVHWRRVKSPKNHRRILTASQETHAKLNEMTRELAERRANIPWQTDQDVFSNHPHFLSHVSPWWLQQRNTVYHICSK